LSNLVVQSIAKLFPTLYVLCLFFAAFMLKTNTATQVFLPQTKSVTQANKVAFESILITDEVKW